MRSKECDHSTCVSEISYLKQENETRIIIVKLSSETINASFNKRKKIIYCFHTIKNDLIESSTKYQSKTNTDTQEEKLR